MGSGSQPQTRPDAPGTGFGGVWWAAPVVAGAAIISGVGHRIAGQWQPQGDDAAIAWLSRDVFSAHSPLLGMPSTVGGRGADAHHWGPLLFWLFALPERLGSASPAGMQLALLTLQLGMFALIAWFSSRRVGRIGALAILVVFSVLSWSMGRDLLSSVWNPSIALIPLAAVFVLAWSLADGDEIALVPLAFTASFVVQCNILYTPLVGLLVAWAVVGWWVTCRARRRSDSATATVAPISGRRRWNLIAAFVVILIAWSGPILYEVTHQPGNVQSVLSSGFGESGEHVGVRRAFNGVAKAVGVPPVWWFPSAGVDLTRAFETPTPLSVGSGLLIGGVVLAAFGWSWRRRPELRALLGTAIFGAVGGAIVAARLPVGFGVAFYRTWNLWVVSAFVWIALAGVGVAVGRDVIARRSDSGTRARILIRRVVIGTLVAALVVFAGLGATGRSPTAMRDGDESAAVRRLVAQTRRRLVDRGPYLVLQRVQHIGSGVMWGLVRHGYDLRVSRQSRFDAPYLAASHGPAGTRWPRLEIVEVPVGSSSPARGRLVASTNVRASVGANEEYRRVFRLACAQTRKDPPTVTARGRALEISAPNSAAARALRALAVEGSPCRVLRRDVLDDLRRGNAVAFSPETAAFANLLETAAHASADQRYEVRVRR